MTHCFQLFLFQSLALFPFLFMGCGLSAGPPAIPPFATFSSTPVALSTANSRNPQITIDSMNRIFVVWEDTAAHDILFTSSNNNGATFQVPPILIPGSVNGTFPRIATDGNGNVYLVWFSSSSQGPVILLNYKLAGGNFQTTPVQVSTTLSQFPQNIPPADITFGANTLYISWSQCSNNCLTTPVDDVFYSTVSLSSNPISITPSSLSKPINISNRQGTAFFTFAGYPKISLFNGIPYILFQSSTPATDLYLNQLVNPNTPKQSEIKVSTPVSAIAQNASLGVDKNGNSYVAWNPSTTPTSTDIFFSVLNATSSSLSFSPPKNITNSGSASSPAVAIDSSQFAYVAFFAKPAGQTNFDLFLIRTTDGGATFAGSLDISNSPSNIASYAPGFAIVGKTGYLVWDNGNVQIFFQTVSLK